MEVFSVWRALCCVSMQTAVSFTGRIIKYSSRFTRRHSARSQRVKVACTGRGGKGAFNCAPLFASPPCSVNDTLALFYLLRCGQAVYIAVSCFVFTSWCTKHQASEPYTCTQGTTDIYWRAFLFLCFVFCHRATGGPEVAMGTGPWPQPPTEAEQLQALMAAANGESCTSSSFLLLLSLTLHPFIFWPNLLVPCTLLVVVCVGRLSVWVCCWRATSQTGSLTRPASISIFFPVWRLSRGRLPQSRITGHDTLQLWEQTAD